jgi:4-hydroxy-tetrahydrodipicolinate reductase
MIRVVVSGSGQMGALVVETIEAQNDMEVAGVIEPLEEAGDHISTSGTVYGRHADPAELFAVAHPDVVVDFTNASFTPHLVEAALANGVRPVIGTSGQTEETIEALRAGCAERGVGAVVAANFAIGGVVLMHLAQIASRHFDYAEVIEQHHERKVDAPSGTALETARLMREARGADFEHNEPDLEHIPGGRGAEQGGVAIHSVRLQGLVAHQEVIFGGQGQTLTLRHDSMGRDSFMPGVLLAVREVMQRDRLVIGLEELIGLG